MTHTLPALPPRIARLRVDERGYPVPFFVAWINGVPDFRVVDPAKMLRCIHDRACWICGEKLGANVAYVIGPMCAITRTSAEPPMHVECAEFSARACPFLTRPKQKRNEHDMPEDRSDPAGVMIKRNPGVALVWITREKLTMKDDGSGGVLFDVGKKPERVVWYAEGREATRTEVLASIDSGYPTLLALASGPTEVAELDAMRARAMPFLPAESRPA